MITAQLIDMTEYEAQFPLPLLARDRCDRCGAQAHVATRHEGGELLWCCHHFTEHEAELTAARVA
jgi:hypothetical protein